METYLTLAAVWTLGVISPGPDFVAVLRTAMRSGARTASATAMGVMAGIALWIVLALVGFSALVEAQPWIATAMRVAGALFLVGFGLHILWGLWRSRGSAAGAHPAADAPTAPRSTGAAFRLGLATNVANPKALVFFGALFSTLLPPDLSWAARGGVLLMMLAIGTAWFLLVAWAASRPPLVRLYERAGRAVDAVAAAVFVVLGIVLLME